MENFLVIGLGRFGSSVARTLYEAGKEVIGIDVNEDLVQNLIDVDGVNNAIIGDATDKRILENIGVSQFDCAFVCMKEIEASILITVNLKELGVKKIICKAANKKHGKILSAIGADQLVYPEEYMGRRIAELVMDRNLIEHLRFDDNFMLVEIKAPKQFWNKTLIELNFRNKYNANIVGLKKIDGNFIANPLANTIIEEKDILLIISDKESAKKIEKLS